MHPQRKDNDDPLTCLFRADILALLERYQVTDSGEQFLFFKVELERAEGKYEICHLTSYSIFG